MELFLVYKFCRSFSTFTVDSLVVPYNWYPVVTNIQTDPDICCELLKVIVFSHIISKIRILGFRFFVNWFIWYPNPTKII